jgi:hypothetical protein
VLYVLFAAGRLRGALFPEIEGGLLSGFATPAPGVDEAKLLAWSFVAGFAEKFVPDRLDRLNRRAGSKERTGRRRRPQDE